MARQAGPIFITGTIGDVIFYKLGDHYYMRQKGEPTPATKKRMRQPEHYRLLCLRKQEFKQASQMVREWYYTLPKEVRKHGLFGKLTGKALEWLRAGKTKEEIKALGLKAAMPKQKVSETEKQTKPIEECAIKEGIIKELSLWHISANGSMNSGCAEKHVQIHMPPPPLPVSPFTDTLPN